LAFSLGLVWSKNCVGNKKYKKLLFYPYP
jgi:hypothetical protein